MGLLARTPVDISPPLLRGKNSMTAAFCEPASASAMRWRTSPLDGSDKRILIVDDEEMVRSLFVSCLDRTYLCFAAASSDEALAYLDREPFALVISDVIMPGRSCRAAFG
jgi:PleD family two-component response regulator